MDKCFRNTSCILELREYLLIFLGADFFPGWGTPSVIYGAEDTDGESCLEGVS